MPFVIDIGRVASSPLGPPVRWYGLILVVVLLLAAHRNGRAGSNSSRKAEASQP